MTAAGDIPRFSVDGVSGDVLLDLTGTPDEIQINTVSGDSTIRITEAVGARYRINTVSGRMQLDGVIVIGSPGRAYADTTGSLDGSWVDISVNSVSGNVSVLRSAAANTSEASA